MWCKMDEEPEGRIYMKVHRRGGDILLAACDEDIIDKRFREGIFRLHVKRDFYGGDLVAEEVFIRMLQQCTMANLSGKFVVELAIKEGYILEENVLYVEGVPHAQLLKL